MLNQKPRLRRILVFNQVALGQKETLNGHRGSFRLALASIFGVRCQPALSHSGAQRSVRVMDRNPALSRRAASGGCQIAKKNLLLSLHRCMTRFENPWQFRGNTVKIKFKKRLITEYCVISLPTLSHP